MQSGCQIIQIEPITNCPFFCFVTFECLWDRVCVSGYRLLPANISPPMKINGVFSPFFNFYLLFYIAEPATHNCMLRPMKFTRFRNFGFYFLN